MKRRMLLSAYWVSQIVIIYKKEHKVGVFIQQNYNTMALKLLLAKTFKLLTKYNHKRYTYLFLMM
jgi:hypothetical protein